MAKLIKKATPKESSNKRELIAPNGDNRYIKRNEKGQIKESDDVSKSLSKDVRQTAKKKVKPGYGDQGDQSRQKSTAKNSSPKKVATKKAARKKG